MPKTITVMLWVLLASALIISLIAFGNGLESLYAQGGPTSTLVPATPTPEGTPAPTFIPSAPQQPTPIILGETIAGELLVGRWAIYEFVGIAGTQVTIRVRSSDFDPLVELYTPTDYSTPLFTDDDSGRGRNATLYAIDLPSDGVYRIFARSYKNEGSGAYLVSVEPGAGATPDISTTTQITYNEVIQGTLEGEQDYYAFTGQSGDVVSVLLSSSAFDTYLEVIDSAGRILDDNDDNGRDKNSAVTNILLPADGIYFVIVASYTLNASGDYQVELLRVDPTLSTSGTLSFNTIQTARLLPDVIDQWTFEGAAGQRISLSAMPVNFASELDLILEVTFPSEGREINDDGGFQRNPALVDYVLPETGTYTVALREFNATIGGDYYLVLYDGRRYFAPDGEPGLHLSVDDIGQTHVIDTMTNPGTAFALYTVHVPANQWLSVRIATGNGGSGLAQDFLISVMDTAYNNAIEPNGGTTSVQNAGIPADFLILLQYRGPGQQGYRMTLDLSDTPPPIIDLPILGILEIGTPYNGQLPTGVRHARTFVATVDGLYTITLNKADNAESYDPYLYVLNERGETIAQNDDGAGGLDPQIQLELGTGEQIIVVAASFADATGGAYQLQITQE